MFFEFMPMTLKNHMFKVDSLKNVQVEFVYIVSFSNKQIRF
jgi:hypothetical protein